jgi:hypothetical protein
MRLTLNTLLVGMGILIGINLVKIVHEAQSKWYQKGFYEAQERQMNIRRRQP